MVRISRIVRRSRQKARVRPCCCQWSIYIEDYVCVSCIRVSGGPENGV